MLTRLAIALAALAVAAYSVAARDWTGLAAVVVVCAAIWGWRPSWLRADVSGAGPEELALEEAAVQLVELERWRRILVPVAAVAVVVQGVALHRLLTAGEDLGASVLATVVASLLVGWAFVTQRRIERLTS